MLHKNELCHITHYPYGVLKTELYFYQTEITHVMKILEIGDKQQTHTGVPET